MSATESWDQILCPGPVDVQKVLDDADIQKAENGRKVVPYFLNPFRMQTAGLTLSYFDVGIAIYFLTTPITFYLISHLNISATEYNAYATLLSLPWSFKFLFGLVTDCVPINGYRRKSWLFAGWVSFVGISFYMSTISSPGFILITVTTLFMAVSYLFADVCADSMVVERARYENIVIKGSLQTSAYTIRSFGATIGAILGATLYNTPIWGWGLDIAQLFLVSALIPLIGVVPAIWNLEELAPTAKAPSLSEQLESIWTSLQRRAVWLPVSFIYIYNVFQIPNAAWTNFLIVALDFSDFEIGMLTVASAVLFWLGMLTYKAFFFETGWRMIYIYMTLISAGFSLLQILLILGINKKMGIPDFYFALGDSSITTFVQAILFMPACILFAMLCPDGSEGVTYALLTTISNLAGTVASDIGTAMTLIWNVDNAALASGDYTGMLYLTILTSCLQIFPLCLVWILPDSKAEQRKLCESEESSWWAGFTLASVIFLSLAVSIGVNIYFIIAN